MNMKTKVKNKLLNDLLPSDPEALGKYLEFIRKIEQARQEIPNEPVKCWLKDLFGDPGYFDSEKAEKLDNLLRRLAKSKLIKIIESKHYEYYPRFRGILTSSITIKTKEELVSKITIPNLNKFQQYIKELEQQMVNAKIIFDRLNKLKEQGDNKNKHPKAPKNFISENRISSLRKIKNQNFDLKKLIKLCEELNQNYKSENYLTISILARAIKDHVPPIFEFKTFSKVANNFSFSSRSTKKSILNLQNSFTSKKV